MAVTYVTKSSAGLIPAGVVNDDLLKAAAAAVLALWGALAAQAAWAFGTRSRS